LKGGGGHALRQKAVEVLLGSAARRMMQTADWPQANRTINGVPTHNGLSVTLL